MPQLFHAKYVKHALYRTKQNTNTYKPIACSIRFINRSVSTVITKGKIKT